MIKAKQTTTTVLELNFFFQVLSRDSVTVTVDAVVYYRVSNPTMATNNVEDFRFTLIQNLNVLDFNVKSSLSNLVTQPICWLPQHCETFWALNILQKYCPREKPSVTSWNKHLMRPLTLGVSKSKE